MRLTFLLAAAFALIDNTLNAGPLTEARVTRIINDVSVVDPASGPRKAELQTVIKDQIGLKTGIKSRSELLFQDNTLTRVGPESYFSFTAGTRDMSLEKGTMLLQVPKGLGGAKIRTAAVTAAITGTTIMIEHIPGKNLKVLVLEGSLRLSVNGRFGDSLLLLPGKMVIMPPNAKRIPEPVSVDIAKVVKTSSLVTMGDAGTAPLPSMPLIEKEIATQAAAKNGKNLADTNLVILGRGTKVVMASDDVIRRLDNAVSTQPTGVGSTPTGTPGPLPTPGITPAPTGSTGNPTPTPAPTGSTGNTGNPTPTPAPTPTGSDDDAETDDNDFDHVANLGNDNAPSVSVDSPVDLSTGGRSGKVKIRSRGPVTINSTIKVSESAGPTPSKLGGEISVRSKKTHGTAISVTSSAQLLSLLNASATGRPGSIRFRSAGGAVNVTGATLQADRGKIDIRNTGASGAITLDNATLNASTVKVRALGNNGQLNIGGGSISADTVIDLYAGGSNGEVNFTDNVTLSGTSVKTISGNTVTVRDGKIVTVTGSGPANVFTNNPNYTGSGGNGSTTGSFAGSGATTQPLSAGPGG